MKILVTGGAGFIGSNFLNLLVPRHPEHQFLNIDKLGYASNLHNLSAIEGCSNYHFARLDLTDVDGVNDCFEREAPDVVVHFAAESHVDRSIKSPTGFIQSNIVGTFNLLEAFRNASHTPSRFHHVSTDEVYGSLGPEGRFVEDSPYDPSSPYSASKAASASISSVSKTLLSAFIACGRSSVTRPTRPRISVKMLVYVMGISLW